MAVVAVEGVLAPSLIQAMAAKAAKLVQARTASQVVQVMTFCLAMGLMVLMPPNRADQADWAAEAAAVQVNTHGMLWAVGVAWAAGVVVADLAHRRL